MVAVFVQEKYLAEKKFVSPKLDLTLLCPPHVAWMSVCILSLYFLAPCSLAH